MICSFIEEKDLLIDLLFIFGFLGRTINEILVLLFNSKKRKLLSLFKEVEEDGMTFCSSTIKEGLLFIFGAGPPGI